MRRHMMTVLVASAGAAGLACGGRTTDRDFVVEGENLYRTNRLSGGRTFVKKLYDKDFHAKHYEVDGGTVYRKDPNSGKRYAVKRHFQDGFEDASSIHDLIDIERGWTSFTLLSPRSPTIPDYNALRHRILARRGDFLDNRVEPSPEHAHTGHRSLKCYSVPPASGMVCCKASLETELLHFVKGDDVWFSAWFYFVKAGRFNTLADLECTFVKNHPGMRIVLCGGTLAFQLAKWPGNPMYRQPGGRPAPFPNKQWVHVKARLHLSEGADGIVQLWQDGKRILDARGQTLPFAEAVYDDLEIGLTAHSFGPDDATLYVDDLVISAAPIP